MGDALNKIAAQDPTITVEYSKELRQTILSGMGEQHINYVKWRVNNEFKQNIELYAPKVPYRETITKIATAQYRHKKQSGGAGQFGEVHLLVCPYVEGQEAPKNFKIDGKDTVRKPRRTSRSTARTPCSTSRARTSPTSSGAASWNSTTASSAVPSTSASCPPS